MTLQAIAIQAIPIYAITIQAIHRDMSQNYIGHVYLLESFSKPLGVALWALALCTY